MKQIIGDFPDAPLSALQDTTPRPSSDHPPALAGKDPPLRAAAQHQNAGVRLIFSERASGRASNANYKFNSREWIAAASGIEHRAGESGPWARDRFRFVRVASFGRKGLATSVFTSA
jgi:hypothetical protein